MHLLKDGEGPRRERDAVLLVGLLIWWQSAGKYTTVPRVGGLAADTARLEVRNEGLTATMGKPEFSARVAAGERSALIDTCASLRDSLDRAVAEGRLEVTPP